MHARMISGRWVRMSAALQFSRRSSRSLGQSLGSALKWSKCVVVVLARDGCEADTSTRPA